MSNLEFGPCQVLGCFTEEQHHQDIQNINTDINMYHARSLAKSKHLGQICYVINIYDDYESSEFTKRLVYYPGSQQLFQ